MSNFCKICGELDNIHLHHIVPRAWFPEEYKKGKKYDMYHFQGKLVSNRIGLCVKHHDMIHKFVEARYIELMRRSAREGVSVDLEEVKEHIYSYSQTLFKTWKSKYLKK